MAEWSSEVHDKTFERWFARELDGYEQAVLRAAIEKVLETFGPAICDGEWGKPLGKGLFEFRVRQSLHAIRTFGQTAPPPAPPGDDREVLLRVFVTFHGAKIILILHGLNKRKDNSKRRQDTEIARARKLLKRWKAQTRR